ncbi:adenylate cyclase, partial [Cichlidogyrus casuarinus]
VTIMNDLLDRFDDLCNATECEKIATIGDAYCCVAGLPLPRKDHAFCCIEMGLAMCRIMKRFNLIHHENLKIRVGAHCGTVIAAIIGKTRFRYDIYSRDVSLANQMESTGRSGRLHVTEAMMVQASKIYNFGIGEEIEFYGQQIKTYYVDPRSSYLRRKHERFGSEQVTYRRHQFETVSSSSDMNNNYNTLFTADSALRNMLVLDSANSDEFINNDLRHAHDQPMSLKPLSLNGHKIGLNFLERSSFEFDLIEKTCVYLKTHEDKDLFGLGYSFKDNELEWHYQRHAAFHKEQIDIDSFKIAPVLDSVMMAVATTTMGIHFCNFKKHFLDKTDASQQWVDFGTMIAVIAASWSISFMFYLVGKLYKSDLHSSGHYRRFYSIMAIPLVRQILHFLALSCNFVFLFRMYQVDTLSKKNFLLKGYFTSVLMNISCYIAIMPTYCDILVRFVGLLVILAMSFILRFYYSRDKSELITPMKNIVYSTCTNKNEDLLRLQPSPYLVLFDFIQPIIITLMIEYINRSSFIIKRDANIALDDVKQIQEDTERLLGNVLPNFLLDSLLQKMYMGTEDITLNFAENVETSAVAFILINDLFKYSDEDMGSLLDALKVMNHVVCSFDKMLPKYPLVEKIKTTGQFYMLAAGFNKETEFEECLEQLLDFCFVILQKLEPIARQIGYNDPELNLQIGINTGQISTGIIGATKPLYDIWGDTVNIASRMCTNCPLGEIQVTSMVYDRLSNNSKYKLVKRGKIGIKGKGLMETYLCYLMGGQDQSTSSSSSSGRSNT